MADVQPPPDLPQEAANAAPFALTPALAGGQEPINYNNRTGQSLYSQATNTLTYLFTGKDSSLPAFLQAIRDRSDAAGWDDIFQITIDVAADGAEIQRNLLTHYGEINLDQVRENATEDYIGLPVRNAQISHQIYQALRKSVSTDVNERMVTESAKFYINGHPDGPSFLKTMIDIYFVKTNATTTTIRLKIADTHLIIAEHEFNIDSFNTELNAYVQQLAANGNQTEDLFAHLTRAYRTVPDKQFHAYIMVQINSHNDGTNEIDATQLMDRAKTKYDELKEANTWMQKDETEQQLVALTAQLQQVQSKNRQLQKKLKGDKPKGKDKAKSNKANSDNKWAWKDRKPPAGSPHTKTFEGRDYHWCPFHEKWTIHKPEDCRLNLANKGKKTSTDDRPSTDAVNLTAALEQDALWQ